jgi:hypothetical protein
VLPFLFQAYFLQLLVNLLSAAAPRKPNRRCSSCIPSLATGVLGAVIGENAIRGKARPGTLHPDASVRFVLHFCIRAAGRLRGLCLEEIKAMVSDVGWMDSVRT